MLVARLRSTSPLFAWLLLVACGGNTGPTEAQIAAMSDVELRDRLLELVERDQAAREAMIEATQHVDPAPDGSIRLGREAIAARRGVEAIDAESTAFLETMIRARGWPHGPQSGTMLPTLPGCSRSTPTPTTSSSLGFWS